MGNETQKILGREIECAYDYEIVAASQTTQALGATGAVGDLLRRVIVTANTGIFTVFDGAVPVIVFPASSSIGEHEIGLKSVSGAWNVTTAAATAITAVGKFT